MSVLIGSASLSSMLNTCRNGITSVRNTINGLARDLIEEISSIIIPAIIVSECTTDLISNKFLREALGLGAGAVSYYLFKRFIKPAVIEREVESAIANSKTNPKSALMIHTTQDHNGAFSSTHAVSRVFRDCAKRHSIDRIRGMTYQERLKVQGKKYDVIAIMAHGQSKVINMDGEFFGFTGSSLKKIGFLSCRLKEGGKIILCSCSTGQGDDNVAKAISEGIPHATVYAPSKDVYAAVGEEFDEDMTPTFNDGILFKGNDMTRVYKSGRLIYTQTI